jgi:hypothetical protein
MTDTKTPDPGGPGGTSAIGSTGVWIRTDAMTARETAELSRRVEALGYGAFWFPEIRGRNTFVQAGWLLAATERLHVATGTKGRPRGDTEDPDRCLTPAGLRRSGAIHAQGDSD